MNPWLRKMFSPLLIISLAWTMITQTDMNVKISTKYTGIAGVDEITCRWENV